MGTPDDKRRQRRVPIELWIEAERDGELYFQRATNLSQGGAYFAQTFPLPKGTVVQLRFTLPGDEKEITCSGEIVATKDLGMGVQFVSLSDEAKERIDGYIDRFSMEVTQA
jgi:uncharacterized protein (TIGR02266 family)